ncbi:MAG: TIGR03013 family PEP-CTERM/XrtA system glycosyltransferase [Burkholderiales bacterium]|nr:TIGR03013 family PEP-CTERM/XrtA system glycosyltransferase [Burkholderiales bacterium]
MIRLFSHWLRARTIFDLAADFSFVLVGVAAAIFWVGSHMQIDPLVVLACALALAITTLSFNAWMGFYQSTHSRSLAQSLLRGAFSLGLAGAVAYAIFTFAPLADTSRDLLAVPAMTAVFGMVVHRLGVAHAGSTPMLVRRVLVFGAGEHALAVRRALDKSDPNVQIVGFYPSPAEEDIRVPADRLLPNTQSLTDTARALKVDEIVVALSERRGGAMPLRELLDCKLIGVKVLDLASHFEQTLGQIRLDSLRAGWLIFGDGFRQGAFRAFLKRLFDIVCASILLLVSLPVMLITAVVIVIESGFPIFYRQERVGRNGRLFNVIKFRSMVTDAEKDGKPQWATGNDARVTRVGRFIRKTRIDELPQIINVLRGDMSLVGPRPERPYFVDQLTREIPFYAVRHSVKPGVTGWAQVRYHYGATVEDSAEKLQYDLYYVKNNSLFLDILVLFETIGVVLTGKGAR